MEQKKKPDEHHWSNFIAFMLACKYSDKIITALKAYGGRFLYLFRFMYCFVLLRSIGPSFRLF